MTKEAVRHAILEWTRGNYRLAMSPDPDVIVDGMVERRIGLGIHLAYGHSLDVTHVASGKRLGGFSTVGVAIEFVERMAYVLDWSAVDPTIPPGARRVIEETRAALEATAFPPRIP